MQSSDVSLNRGPAPAGSVDLSSARVKRSSAALWRSSMGDVVVASSRNQLDPFVLRDGASLWELLAAPCRLSEIIDALGGAPVAEAVNQLMSSLIEAEVVELVAP